MTGLTKAMLIIAIVFAGVIWLNVVMWRRMRRALEARTEQDQVSTDPSSGGGGGAAVDESPSTSIISNSGGGEPSAKVPDHHPGGGRDPVGEGLQILRNVP